MDLTAVAQLAFSLKNSFESSRDNKQKAELGNRSKVHRDGTLIIVF